MTTVKQRTYMQAQFNKADKQVAESKDKILSTVPIREGRITDISGKEVDGKSCVPSDAHPSDHFVCWASLEVPK